MFIDFSLDEETIKKISELKEDEIDGIRLIDTANQTVAKVFAAKDNVFDSTSTETENSGISLNEEQPGSIVHPSYYNQGKFEVKDVIHDWNLNFNLGNVIKYVARAPYKDPTKQLEDYRKALTYLQFEIEYLEQKA